MADYKETINLPTTDFPMKADLPKREPLMLAHWKSLNLYQLMCERNAGKKKFILHDGPPYANGHIHLGHAVNKILKDIVVKSKHFSGYDSPYIPGWDCHGLPIELNVEKKEGKPGVKISATEFRKACRAYANEQVQIQSQEFQRLGIFGDFEKPYKTMDFSYEAEIVRALATIVDNGHLYQGRKPVHWCVDCGSALAEAEVEYKDKNSQSIDVSFPFQNPSNFLARISSEKEIKHKGEGPISIVIWTTTPWTLPANQAVAVNPEEAYVLVEAKTTQNTKRFVIAEALLSACMKRYDVESYQVLAEFSGKILEGLILLHPFYEKQVRVVLSDHVTLDSGTGCVHIAPGHGQEDYLVAMRYELPIENPVGDNGCFLKNTPLFAGVHVSKANPLILEQLTIHGNLLHAHSLVHSYPHCWRHKTPLIFRATPQWFIRMEKMHLRDDALKAIQQVTWVPEWGQARIESMIENRPDWCVSRQRTWGVPMALFVHKETGELHPNITHLMREVAADIEKHGVDIWFESEAEKWLGNEAEHYKKISDTLDVWFDSGVSFAAVVMKNPALQFPADLYLEGSDQHRGWFQSSLLTSVAMTKTAPYRQVLTHGFTVDAAGRKMSKSLGNGIEPEQVIQKMGADMLRLWIAATDYRSEMTWSEEVIGRVTDTYRRIRNTARYFIANLNDFSPEKDLVPGDNLNAIDQYILLRAKKLQSEIIKAYEDYQFHLVYQKIHHFCAIELGSFYLDIIKDRQYTLPKAHRARRSSQTVLFHLAHAMVRWLAPILSFTAEEIYGYLPGEKPASVFLNDWYDKFPAIASAALNQINFWDKIIFVRDLVNKKIEEARNEGAVGSGLEAEVSIIAGKNYHEALAALKDELKFILIVSKVSLFSQDEETLTVEIRATENEKCVRCWHRTEGVGKNPEYLEICERCVSNITGVGEKRELA